MSQLVLNQNEGLGLAKGSRLLPRGGMIQLQVVLAVLFLTASVLSPKIVSISGVISIRVEDFALALLLAVQAWRIFGNYAPVKLHSTDLWIVGSLGALIIVCLLSSFVGMFSDDPFRISVFCKEVMRLLKYVGVYIAFLGFPIKEERGSVHLLYLLGCSVVLVQLFQYTDLLGCNTLMTRLFGGEIFFRLTEISFHQAGMFRAGATFVNPNVCGAFLQLPYAYALSSLMRCIITRRAYARGVVFPYAALVGVLVLGIFLTQSRTALIATGILTTVVLVRTLRMVCCPYLKLALITGGALLAGGGVCVLISLFGLRRSMMFGGSLSELASLSTKLMRLREATAQMTNYLLGISPGRAFVAVDFNHGQILYWYGLAGLATYGVFVWSVVRGLCRQVGNSREATALIAIQVSLLVIGFTASSFLNGRIFPVFLAFLAMRLGGEAGWNFGEPPAIGSYRNLG